MEQAGAFLLARPERFFALCLMSDDCILHAINTAKYVRIS